MLFPVCNFGPASGGGSVPTQSIQFVRASSQYLTMSSANFGAYDRAKFAVSAWIKRASAGINAGIMGHNGASDSFTLQFSSDNTLLFSTSSDGSSATGRLITSATYSGTSAYYHVLVWYDSANATANDRMRVWVNGTEVTSFSNRVNPSAAIFSNSAAISVGAQSSTGSNLSNGLQYQSSFFSSSLPLITSLYNAGAPLSVTGLTGLWSTLDVAGGVVTHDGVLATAWTNNNTATASSTIP